MKNIIVIGAGGHGRVIADLIKKLNNYQNVYFLDDFATGEVLGCKIIGKTDDYVKYVNDYEFFVAIGNNKLRKSVIEKLINSNAKIATLIHPSAVIANNVEIGFGTCVIAGAVINPCAKIGNGVIINTSSSIDHDCVIGDYTHVSVGVRVAGGAKTESDVWLCIGAVVSNGVSICENVTIGAGAVVLKDITESGVYVGVPAKKVKEI